MAVSNQIVRHKQLSICIRNLHSYYFLIISFRKFYKILNHNSVACVQLIGCNLPVAKHTYKLGYDRDFVVLIVYEMFCCLQARNE